MQICLHSDHITNNSARLIDGAHASRLQNIILLINTQYTDGSVMKFGEQKYVGSIIKIGQWSTRTKKKPARHKNELVYMMLQTL